VDGDEEIEQDDSLVRTQGVTGHRGQWRGEPAGQQHQQAVWGLHTGQVMCHQQWQSCVAFSLKSSSSMSPPWVPLSLCVCRESSAIVDCDEERDQDRALVRVRGVAGYRGRRRGWREGLPHQPANRLGHVTATSCRLRCWTPPDDLVQASAMVMMLMMLSFICSFRNKNEPKDIYPTSGYSPPRNKEAHVMKRPP